MDATSDICCLCLSETNFPFTELFAKNSNGLNHFDKISSALYQLKTVFNDNSDYDYKLCSKCCDTIEMIYQFNITSLYNIEVFLSKQAKRAVFHMLKNDETKLSPDSLGKANERTISDTRLITATNFSEEIFVKQEICGDSENDDEPNLANICQVDIQEEEGEIVVKKSVKSKKKAKRKVNADIATCSKTVRTEESNGSFGEVMSDFEERQGMARVIPDQDESVFKRVFRLNNLESFHLPTPFGKDKFNKRVKRKRCRYCYEKLKIRKESVYGCEACLGHPGLCLKPCFEIFHIENKLL